MHTVYVLSSPNSGKARYVGITSCALSQRVRAHRSTARVGDTTLIACWLRTVFRRGQQPVVTVLEVTDDRERETFWIRTLRAEGHPLVNQTDGPGTLNASPRLRRRLSISASKRQPITEVTRAKLRLAAAGRQHTDATKDRMRKPKTEAHKQAAANGLQRARDAGTYRLATGEANGMRKHPEAVLRGTLNPTSKLTNESVIELRRLYGTGLSTVKIAELFHISQATAWRIIRRLSWAHI